MSELFEDFKAARINTLPQVIMNMLETKKSQQRNRSYKEKTNENFRT